MHIGDEDNVRLIMQHEKHMSGSDAILHGETLHPRAYGTFTRYLGKLVCKPSYPSPYTNVPLNRPLCPRAGHVHYPTNDGTFDIAPS